MKDKKRTEQITETAGKKKCRKRRKERKIQRFLSNKGYVVTTRMTVFSSLFILTQITCGGVRTATQIHVTATK